MPAHRFRRLAVVVTGLVTIRYISSPEGRAAISRTVDRTGRRLRYWSGRLQGVSYRLRNRHPDPEVADGVLADRVRSTLGPLHKQLDIPRPHIHVEDHVAYLHGDVPTHRDATVVEDAAAQVTGVTGVESYLNVAPIPAAQRPSSGGLHPPASEARKLLVDAAHSAGAPVDIAERVVRAVLGFLADRVPADEFSQFAAHLPADVRAMCIAPHRVGTSRTRTVAQLVASLAPATDPLTEDAAQQVIEAVFGALRGLVPEEDLDIAAVLPQELREFWFTATP